MNTSENIVLLFLLLWRCSSAFIQSEKHTLDKAVRKIAIESQEKYIFDYTTVFVFFHQRSSWEEAQAMCKGNNGTLAILNEQEKYEFIGTAMAESAFVNTFEYMWIGASYHDNKFHWENNTRTNIKTRFPSGEKFPREQYPPWQEDPTNKNFSGRCLAVNRIDHENAVFVPLPCRLHRQVICELYEPQTSETNKDGFEIDGIIYFIFNFRNTWLSAVRFCRDNNMEIAYKMNTTHITFLAQRMLRLRPVIESAWIGGHFDNITWSWIDNEPIDTLGTTSIEVEGSSTVKYPPWFRNPVMNSGCLLLDRHVCLHPVFLEAKCQWKKPFICSRASTEPIDPGSHLKPINGTHLWVSLKMMTWEDARRTCKSFNYTLLSFSNYDTKTFSEFITVLKTVMIETNVAKLPGGIQHIWLGARLVKKQWRWVGQKWPKTEDFIGDGFTNKFIFKFGERSYETIKFCTDAGMEDRGDMDCLNLTRENHVEMILYGLTCGYMQNYICVADKING